MTQIQGIVILRVISLTPAPVTRPSTWLMTFGGLPWTLRQVAKASRGSLWTWLKKAVGDILKDTNLVIRMSTQLSTHAVVQQEQRNDTDKNTFSLLRQFAFFQKGEYLINDII